MKSFLQIVMLETNQPNWCSGKKGNMEKIEQSNRSQIKKLFIKIINFNSNFTVIQKQKLQLDPFVCFFSTSMTSNKI
jgi:hypothetical protein